MQHQDHDDGGDSGTFVFGGADVGPALSAARESHDHLGADKVMSRPNLLQLEEPVKSLDLEQL